jgi:hypothetical protein
MPLVTTRYQSDAGAIYRIRLDIAKAAIAGNGAPAGAITDPNVEVEVAEAGNRRKFGIHPRGVRFQRIGSGSDLNKVFRVFIPALTPASFTALSTAASITYKGQIYDTPTVVPES